METKDGKWTSYVKFQIEWERNYKDGNEDGKRTLSGKMKFREINYKDGKLDG